MAGMMSWPSLASRAKLVECGFNPSFYHWVQMFYGEVMNEVFGADWGRSRAFRTIKIRPGAGQKAEMLAGSSRCSSVSWFLLSLTRQKESSR